MTEHDNGEPIPDDSELGTFEKSHPVPTEDITPMCCGRAPRPYVDGEGPEPPHPHNHAERYVTYSESDPDVS